MNIKSGAGLDLALLKNPPADCEASYSWLWNVPVNREDIDVELSEITRAGVRSLYVLAMPKDFRPERTRTYLEPEYLTTKFNSLVEYAIRKMVELGITPWLYDEGGWPSGGACGRTLMQYPEGHAALLKTRSVSLKRGECFEPTERTIALYDKRTRLSLPYTADCECSLTEYYYLYNTETSGDTDRGFIDFTDPRVTKTFISNTYEKYRELVGDLFGNTIPLIFTDEPGIRMGTLPKGIFDEFKLRYGYDIRDHLYVICENETVENAAERQARIDYLSLVGEKFLSATFKPLGEWCREHGICYAGHLMADNYPDAVRCGYFSILECLKQMEIPGVDAIWEQIRYPYDNREPYDEVETARMPFFPIIAASAARQTGKNIALTEAVGIYGDGVTPDEAKYVTNYHVIRGINYLSYAHIPFGNQRFSALATRPDYRREKPGFYNLGHLNEYYARISYLARLGYREGDTALYHPTRDYAAGKNCSVDAVVSYRDMGVSLEKRNIPFDIIDDAAILSAEDTGDGLKLGYATYRHIAVPANRYMPDSVRKKIAPYISEGAPTYTFKNEKLRVMTRKLDTGRLWFIFNEGEPTVSEKLDIPDTKHIYRIDVQSGEIYESDGTVKLLCGDIAVLYATDEVLPTVTDEVEYSYEIQTLEPIGYKRFVITFDGLENEWGEGEPSLSDGFSGEITYAADYELPDDPRDNERYEILLEGFSLTAYVKIGKAEFSLGMTPMRRILSGAELERRGKIEITVANSPLDEIKKKRYLMDLYPKAEIGPYIGRLEELEVRVPKLSVGRATIKKLVQ